MSLLAWRTPAYVPPPFVKPSIIRPQVQIHVTSRSMAAAASTMGSSSTRLRVRISSDNCSSTDCVCTAGFSATEVTSGKKGAFSQFHKSAEGAGADATRWLFNEALVRQSPEEGSQVYCNCARNDTQVGRCRIRSTVCAMFNSTEDALAHKVRSNALGCYYGFDLINFRFCRDAASLPGLG